ncbi:hypothetical protein C8Q79DRAFT_927263 [Trametes meyenii]|nr:hypothetical protein C8Q79DRAFT_927263 [Trametes meyenii]
MPATHSTARAMSAPSLAPARALPRVPEIRRVTIVSQPNVLEAKGAALLWRLNTSASVLGAASPVITSPASLRARTPGADLRLQGSPSTPRVSVRAARSMIPLSPPSPSLGGHDEEGLSGVTEEGGSVGRGGGHGSTEPMDNAEPDAATKSSYISRETGAYCIGLSSPLA